MLFADADLLGTADALSNISPAFSNVVGDISDVLVQFAGELAYNHVVADNQAGVLTLSSDSTTLSVSFTQKLWSFGEGSAQVSNIVGLQESVNDILQNAGILNTQLAGLIQSEVPPVDDITFATTNSDTTTTLPDALDSGDYSVFVAGGGNEVIKASSQGQDFILGGDGSTTFLLTHKPGNGGIDAFFGGSGTGTINATGLAFGTTIDIQIGRELEQSYAIGPINYANGTSGETPFIYTDQAGVSEITTFYSDIDQGGSVIGTATTFDDNTSQLTENDGFGGSSSATFVGPNGTGSITPGTFTFEDGSTYTPIAPGGNSDIEIFGGGGLLSQTGQSYTLDRGVVTASQAAASGSFIVGFFGGFTWTQAQIEAGENNFYGVQESLDINSGGHGFSDNSNQYSIDDPTPGQHVAIEAAEFISPDVGTVSGILTIIETVIPDIPNASVTSGGVTTTINIQPSAAADVTSALLAGALTTVAIQSTGGTAVVSAPVTIDILQINSGSSLFVDNTTIATDPVTITTNGNMFGSGAVTGNETNSGTIIAEGGTLDLTGNIGGSGTLSITPGAALELDGSVSATEHLIFGAASETLLFGPTAKVLSVATGLGDGDVIGFSGTAVTSVNFDPIHNNLTIAGSGLQEALALAGTYKSSDFSVVGGAVDVTCFLAGTCILTNCGEVAVEALAAGDLIMTVSGASVPIEWIGYRHLDCNRHPDPRRVWPVEVKKGAFADNAPHRDLRLSPDHAVFVDGLLVPIKLLINGSSIKQIPMNKVIYYHVELPNHDVILAEGLPTESYLDTGNRHMFENGAAPLMLHPDMAQMNDQARRVAESCVPFVCDAERVEPIWRTIAERAVELGLPLQTMETIDDPGVHLRIGEKQFRPISRVGNRYQFVVAALNNDARLVSRNAAPSDVWPWVDDNRQLGVAIREITVRSGTQRTDIALDDLRLTDGWWQVEQDHATMWRWTNGDASLPIEGYRVMIEVVVSGTVPYPMTEPCREETRHAA